MFIRYENSMSWYCFFICIYLYQRYGRRTRKACTRRKLMTVGDVIMGVQCARLLCKIGVAIIIMSLTYTGVGEVEVLW